MPPSSQGHVAGQTMQHEQDFGNIQGLARSAYPGYRMIDLSTPRALRPHDPSDLFNLFPSASIRGSLHSLF